MLLFGTVEALQWEYQLWWYCTYATVEGLAKPDLSSPNGIFICCAIHCSRLVLLEHLGKVPIVQVTAAGLHLLSVHCIQVRLQTLTQR